MNALPSSDLITLSNGTIRAEISPIGAEIMSLTGPDNMDVMWSGDPDWWDRRAPVLFPIIGRAKDGVIRHEGMEYSTPVHGLAHSGRFDIVNLEADKVCLELHSSAATRRQYPFDFGLRVGFELAGRSLRVTARITNSGNTPMPFSFGHHPGFRWPLEETSRRGYRIEFEHPESALVLRPVDGLIQPELQPAPWVGKVFALRDEIFAGGAIVLNDVRSGWVRYSGPDGRTIKVAFRGFATLAFWTRPGAPFICIEPWTAHGDTRDAQGEILQNPRMMTLAPQANCMMPVMEIEI